MVKDRDSDRITNECVHKDLKRLEIVDRELCYSTLITEAYQQSSVVNCYIEDSISRHSLTISHVNTVLLKSRLTVIYRKMMRGLFMWLVKRENNNSTMISIIP